MTEKGKNGFQKLIGTIKDLPTLPESVARVVKILDDPKSSSRELSEAIRLDQSLTTRLLKIVNSAYYGFPRQIDTIDKAVMVLGYRSIRELILLTSLFEEIRNKSSKNNTFSHKEFWNHTIGCAAAAKVISSKINIRYHENIFLAGLLHDIGKLILDVHLHDQYKEAREIALKKGLLLIEAEELVLGARHTDFGYWLAEEWNLPLSLTSAVTYHHDPTQAPDNFILACLVHIGDILARALEIGNGGDEVIPAINRQAFSALNLTPQIMESVAAELFEVVEGITLEF